MDKIQPLEHQIQAEAFGHDDREKFELKTIKTKDELIFAPIRQYEEPEIEECQLDGIVIYADNNGEERRDKDSPLHQIIPRVIVTIEGDPLDHFPLPNFDNLWKVSLFHMNYTGNSGCKILTPCGGVLYKGIYPRTLFCESCQAELAERLVEVIDPRNSDVMFILKYTTPAYQICYEEETTVVEILEPDGNVMATITQKKTWMNARISRDVTIQPGEFGKANVYKAEFNWEDTSVNFKTTRSGLIVATMVKNLTDKNSATAFTLQILRDIKPRDKAILVGFMIARDLLMIDERQTRQIVEKVTAFIVFLLILVVVMYFFI